MSASAPVLQGIRVVEVATFVFAPAAATVMADFGAEVIKIEHPVTGDPYRYLPQLKPLPDCEHNYCWLLDGRSKKSIALDLKHNDGRDVALDLVRRADVFLTNSHPSVLESLRLRWEDLAPENPRLVYAHATGYGEVGPEAEKPGYDATAWWARSGMMDAVRPGGGELGLATPGMGDHPSSMSVLAGILLALYARERTGRGTKVSTSLMANGVWANSIYVQAALCGAAPYQAPNRATTPNALVNTYATADGRHFYLAMVQEAREWERFCAALGRPDLCSDPRFAELPARRSNAPALAAILDDLFARRSLEEWRQILDRHEVTFGLVARTHDLPEDEQMEANGAFVEIEGAGGLRTVASPIQLAGAAKVPPRRAPRIGEHSLEVLESLGYATEAIERLCRSGAVRTADR